MRSSLEQSATLLLLLLIAATPEAAPSATGCLELGFTETLVCSKCDRSCRPDIRTWACRPARVAPPGRPSADHTRCCLRRLHLRRLEEVVKDAGLAKDCRSCCTEDVDDSASSVKAASAILDICT